MKVKAISLAACGLFTVLGAVGYSARDMAEYAQVAQKRAAEAIREQIPVSVEIDRLEVVRGQLQQQLSQQNAQVAKAQVALEDAEAALVRDRDDAERCLSGLKKLRSLLGTGCQPVKVGCQTVSPGEIRQGLSCKLASYEAKTASVAAREQAVTRQRHAYQSLATRYAEWNQQRELLGHRLEALRSRNAAQQLSTGGAGVFDTKELARASQLADEIELKLRVAEKQQALGTDPLSQLLNVPGATENVEARVDRLFSGRAGSGAE